MTFTQEEDISDIESKYYRAGPIAIVTCRVQMLMHVITCRVRACVYIHHVPRPYRVGAKHGLWTLDWTHGLDCGLRFGPNLATCVDNFWTESLMVTTISKQYF